VVVAAAAAWGLLCLYTLVVPCVASAAVQRSATVTDIPERSPATRPPPNVTE